MKEALEIIGGLVATVTVIVYISVFISLVVVALLSPLILITWLIIEAVT